MRRRLVWAAGPIAAASLALTACSSSGSSYQDKTDRCAKAIAARSAGDNSRPKACDGVKDDDYTTLNVGHFLQNSGVVDDDGNVDLDKLVSPTDTP